MSAPPLSAVVLAVSTGALSGGCAASTEGPDAAPPTVAACVDTEHPTAAGTRPPSGGPDIRGALAREVVVGVMKAKASQFASCVLPHQLEGESVTGGVVLEFVIGEDGRVTRSVADISSVGSPKLELCLASIPCSAAFPRPEDGNPVTVRYPVVLGRAR